MEKARISIANFCSPVNVAPSVDIPFLTHSHTHALYFQNRQYASGYHGHQESTHSYSYTHTTSFGSYRFIGMDACPSPGPRRPFNFFGVLHDVRHVLALSGFALRLNISHYICRIPVETVAPD